MYFELCSIWECKFRNLILFFVKIRVKFDLIFFNETKILYFVSSKTASFCRQRDISEALLEKRNNNLKHVVFFVTERMSYIGEETSKDFEQVARVVVPLEAELVMERHVHQKDPFLKIVIMS